MASRRVSLGACPFRYFKLTGSRSSGRDHVRQIPAVAAHVEDLLAERGIDIGSGGSGLARCSPRDPKQARRAHERLSSVALMEWMPLLTAAQCAKVAMFVASHGTQKAFMETATIIVLDLAKPSFQARLSAGCARAE
jgi:hypothetical protein